MHVASNSKADLEEMTEREQEVADIELQEEFESRHELWQDVDPEVVQEAMEILLPYIQPECIKRIHSVLKQRMNSPFLFENPTNPSIVWACLLTLDS
jgi:hypothetical protein